MSVVQDYRTIPADPDDLARVGNDIALPIEHLVTILILENRESLPVGQMRSPQQRDAQVFVLLAAAVARILRGRGRRRQIENVAPRDELIVALRVRLATFDGLPFRRSSGGSGVGSEAQRK